ncbi:UNVERIFIED_CONTAM: hypothetical protein OHV15_06405 [Microbacterium sp. SLM126]
MTSILLGLLLAAAGGAELVSTTGAMAAMEREVNKGATVLIVDRNDGEIDGSRCLGLSLLEGIRAAGAVSAARTTGFVGYPSIPFQSATATPGVVDILYPDLRLAPETEGLAGEAVIAEIGLVDGSRVTLTDHAALTIGIPKAHGPRTETRARWIYTFHPTVTRASECWIEADVGNTEAVREIVVAAFADVKDLRVHPLSSSATLDITRKSWTERPTQFFWMAGALATGGLVLILLYQRRHEFALYRLLGMGRAQTALVAAAGAMALTTTATLFAVELCLLLACLLPDVPAVAVQLSLTQIVLSASATSVIAAAGAIAASSGNTTRMIRNRN